MAGITRQISEFVAGIGYDRLPDGVASRVKLLLMDTVGIALRAPHDAEPTPSLLAAAARPRPAGAPASRLVEAAGHTPPGPPRTPPGVPLQFGR